MKSCHFVDFSATFLATRLHANSLVELDGGRGSWKCTQHAHITAKQQLLDSNNQIDSIWCNRLWVGCVSYDRFRPQIL